MHSSLAIAPTVYWLITHPHTHTHTHTHTHAHMHTPPSIPYSLFYLSKRMTDFTQGCAEQYFQSRNDLWIRERTSTVSQVFSQGDCRNLAALNLTHSRTKQKIASMWWKRFCKVGHVPGSASLLVHQHSYQSINQSIRFSVNLLTSKDSSHCQTYFSKTNDALAHEWPNLLLYAFPPIALIPQVIRRVREHKHRVLWVSPLWRNHHWISELTQLLIAAPWPIPLRRDLLPQANKIIWHPQPELWALHVWAFDRTW